MVLINGGGFVCGGDSEEERRLGGGPHTRNAGTWEMEGEDQGFKASLGFVRPHLHPCTHTGNKKRKRTARQRWRWNEPEICRKGNMGGVRGMGGMETDMQEGGALNRGSQVGVSVRGSLRAGPGCVVSTMKALASLDPSQLLGWEFAPVWQWLWLPGAGRCHLKRFFR